VFQIGKFVQKNVVNLSIKVANVPKDIIFYITMMKLAAKFMQDGSIKYRQFGTNYTKKRRLGLLVQPAIDRLRRLIKRKAI